MFRKLILISLLAIGLFFIVSDKAQAATEAISYVRQDCAGYSPCYTSLAAWEAAYGGINFGACAQGDLVCADKIAIARIDGPWTSPDTTAVSIDGWTTSAANYIRIYTTASARHDGKRNTSKYRLEGSKDWGAMFRCSEDFVRLEGLQVKNSSVNGSTVIRTDEANYGDIRITDTIVYDSPATDGGGFLLAGSGANSHVSLNNCVAMNIGNVVGVYAYTSWNVYAYNVTSVNNGGAGFRVTGWRTLTCKNCYAGGNTGADYAKDALGTLNLTTSYSEDGTLSTPTAAWSTSSGGYFTNVTAGSEDIHIGSSSTLKDAGTDLSGDSYWIDPGGSVDIDGDARSTWDVGADEYVGGGGGDTTPPTVSITSPTSGSIVSGSSVTISADASDNVGMAGVQFKLDGANLGSENTTSPYSVSWNTTSASNGSHTLTAIARDAAGNQTTSIAVFVTVNNIATDTTPPSTPTNLTATAISSSQINLSWTASTDNVGVTGYRIYRNGSQVGTSSTTNYSDTGLSPSTLYSYTVSAYDAAGNNSSQSSSASATTQSAPSGSRTFYIDYASGSDSDNGTAKTTPWKQAPGMQGCAATCASTIPKPGDSFILKGGDTWPNVVFPWMWSWSGASGNNIYIGVDKTWYIGGSWTRPTFDAGGAAISGTNRMINLSNGLSYITIDEIEFKGMYWEGNPPYGNVTMVFAADATNLLIQNCYFHGWTHAAGASDNLSVVLGITVTTYNAGSQFNYNVVDGSGPGSDSGVAVHYFPTAQYNVIHDLPNGHIITRNGNSIGNHIYNINTSVSGVHENFIEPVQGGTHYIANNVIHHGVGESCFVGGESGEVDYVWDNIFYDLQGNAPAVDSRWGAVSASLWNNTVVPQATGVPCFHQVGSGALGTITIENNHCIGTGALHDFTIGTLVVDHNIVQTPTVANSQGYTSLETYVYSPVAATNSTVGAGTDLTSNCSGTLTSLCSDTTYACTVDGTNHVVCPIRTVVGRPSSGPWDAGAYQYVPSGNIYYIDYSGGNDSNNGTSKSTPWKHAPGMQGCAATCASTTPQPGDRFILKGGVTWPNAVFPINWAWSGTSQNPIYIGVDQTWFTGSTWSRPIFDAQATPISGRNIFIYALWTSNQTWDNIEVKNFSWNGPCPYGSCGVGDWSASPGGITIDNFYIHGWTYTGISNSSGSSCSGTCDNFVAFTGDTNSPYLGDSIIKNSIMDGSDSTNGGDSGEFAHAWPNAKWNIIHDVTNAILPTGHGEIAYNHIYNVKKSFDNSSHENAIETLLANGTFYIHDNVIHDVYGECMMIGNANETDYVWNNVLYQGSTGDCNTVHFPQNNIPGVAIYAWNNTIVTRTWAACFLTATFSPGWTTIAIQNNHCITTGPYLYSPTPSATTLIIDHNVLQTPTTASGQGYTSAQIFAYSPTTSGNATVGAGVNLSSNCSGNLAGLCSDTTYGVSYNSTNHTVSSPARTSLSRPTGSAPWDIGAYQYVSSGGDTTPPAAPTGVSVQ